MYMRACVRDCLFPFPEMGQALGWSEDRAASCSPPLQRHLAWLRLAPAPCSLGGHLAIMGGKQPYWAGWAISRSTDARC
jgi:hypothetical protein